MGSIENINKVVDITKIDSGNTRKAETENNFNRMISKSSGSLETKIAKASNREDKSERGITKTEKDKEEKGRKEDLITDSKDSLLKETCQIIKINQNKKPKLRFSQRSKLNQLNILSICFVPSLKVYIDSYSIDGVAILTSCLWAYIRIGCD